MMGKVCYTSNFYYDYYHHEVKAQKKGERTSENIKSEFLHVPFFLLEEVVGEKHKQLFVDIKGRLRLNGYSGCCCCCFFEKKNSFVFEFLGNFSIIAQNVINVL